jgi:hypothetical protein
LRRCALRVRESAMSAMSEAEFDRLLEAVTMAVATVSPEDILANALVSHAPSKAANDNGLAWPLNPVSWRLVCDLIAQLSSIAGDDRSIRAEAVVDARASEPERLRLENPLTPVRPIYLRKGDGAAIQRQPGLVKVAEHAHSLG